MSKLFIEDTSLTAIGDAIRTKTGGTELLSVPTGMVDAINGITTGGEMKVATLLCYGGGNNQQTSTKKWTNINNYVSDMSKCLVFFTIYAGASGYQRCAWFKGEFVCASNGAYAPESNSYLDGHTDDKDWQSVFGTIDEDIQCSYDATTDNGTITITSTLYPTDYIKIVFVG